MPTDDAQQVGCVLVAAGAGERLGRPVPKALVAVGGRSLLDWAIDGVLRAVPGAVLIVCAPPAQVGEFADIATSRARVVAGGAVRAESVRRGIAALPPRVAHVLVHDAARAFTPPAAFERVLAALAQGHRAVVPAVPVTDSLRSLDGGALDRSRIVAVQTPQGFERTVLERAHAEGDATASDDAVLAERCGVPVHVVEGSQESFKVTRPSDLLLADAMIAAGHLDVGPDVPGVRGAMPRETGR